MERHPETSVTSPGSIDALVYKLSTTTIDEDTDQFNDTGTIIAETEEECRKAAAIISRHCNSTKHLGMDCLWTNHPHNRRERVGLLQLATTQGFCLIVRLCDLQNNISTELKNILNDKNILKAGVGIYQKALFIKCDHNITIRGTIELSQLAAELKIRERNLAELALLCGINVEKPSSSVDWNKHHLTPKQIEYARTTAIAANKVLEKLQAQLIQSKDSNCYNNILKRVIK